MIMSKVSVIIAAYNCEDYVDQAIQSILAQTHQDLEIIICDDHSTDGTWEKLLSYASLENVRLLRNRTNRHAAYTRNRCIAASRGDYIAIQDADDFSEPDRLAKEAAFLDENPGFSFVGSGMTLFDQNGVWLKIYNKQKVPQSKDFLPGLPYSHASLMFRKEALIMAMGYRVARETTRVEDYDLVMRLHAMGYQGYNLNELLYHYRVDKDTLARRKYRFRMDEAVMRYKRFQDLRLLPWGLPYIFMPVLVGLIPRSLRTMIKIRLTHVPTENGSGTGGEPG